MHTPNKVGNCRYCSDGDSFPAVWTTVIAGEVDFTSGPVPVVLTALQTGKDRQSFQIAFNTATQTLAFLENVSFAARLTSLEGLSDQPIGIELNGVCFTTNDLLIPYPFVGRITAQTYTGQQSDDPLDSYVVLNARHNITDGGCCAEWNTKVIFEENSGSADLLFAGVMLVNQGSAQITDIEGFLSCSARYDFNSVETYVRGR